MKCNKCGKIKPETYRGLCLQCTGAMFDAVIAAAWPALRDAERTITEIATAAEEFSGPLADLKQAVRNREPIAEQYD